MTKKEIREVLEEELEFSYRLLSKTFGLEFTKPLLFFGNEEISRRITISSMRGLAFAASILGLYDDEIRGICVPNHILDHIHDNLINSAKRILTFLHELGHAIISQTNPDLKEAKIAELMSSNAKNEKECGYVQHVFDEGLAHYLAIQAGLKSGRDDLSQKAAEEDRRLRNYLDEWVHLEGFEILAKVKNCDPQNWQEVLLRYFEDTVEALPYYQYVVGYRFAGALPLESYPQDLLAVINQPPTLVEHLIYPERYWEVLGR